MSFRRRRSDEEREGRPARDETRARRRRKHVTT
jgi:hypothetical protein